MSEFVQGMLIALIPGVIVSIITAYVTVQLSMKQFYSQRWWEKKAEAYSHIIEHLSYLQFYFEEWFNEGANIRELGDKDKEKLSEGYRQARESIAKASAIGAYIVSNNTIVALAKLLRDLEEDDPKGNWVGDMDEHHGSVKECITRVREYARIDLLKK
jgi:nitrogen fixation/metabolism regulation signal transduction histidine kinase